MPLVLTAVRRADGWTVRTRAVPGGVATLALPEDGDWELRINGPELRWDHVARTLTAGELTAGVIDVRLVANPAITVRVDVLEDRTCAAIALLVDDLAVRIDDRFSFVDTVTSSADPIPRDRHAARVHVPAAGESTFQLVPTLGVGHWIVTIP